MNRILTIFVMIVVCSASIQAQKKKSAAHNNLKKVVVYEQKFDKPLGKPEKDSETMFDSNGNVTEEIEYDNGKIKYHVRYEYNANAEKVKETELNASGKAIKIIEYKYDDKGRKIKEIETEATGKVEKTVEYKYDGDLRTERLVYDANNKLKSKKTYQYQTY